jgi:predicted DNA-binding transcriptional regulator AlpA
MQEITVERVRIIDQLELIHKRPLARLLGVNPWTLDFWRRRGQMPPPVVLSPQIVAWRRRDIARWLEERQTRPASTRVVGKKRVGAS